MGTHYIRKSKISFKGYVNSVTLGFPDCSLKATSKYLLRDFYAENITQFWYFVTFTKVNCRSPWSEHKVGWTWPCAWSCDRRSSQPSAGQTLAAVLTGPWPWHRVQDRRGIRRTPARRTTLQSLASCRGSTAARTDRRWKPRIDNQSHWTAI